ncbi:hypothetical protein BJB45_21480 [Halomonas huangheensis]|uniref:Uncharacterized protein n=1 Tax=Halomonas huangheensis TaxID=1178482 RepID=W1N0U3_9GAMM|nr:hypothetical protein AR456_00615 [Halomonas huangheensis]ERL49212.1 hypothetical protein BJB45_21480 [Halomonas huangheensis]
MLYLAGLSSGEMSGLDGLVDKPRNGRTPLLDERDHQRLQELIAEQPQQIRSLQARFQEESGKKDSTITLRRVLKKITSVSNAFGTLSRHNMMMLISATLRGSQATSSARRSGGT